MDMRRSRTRPQSVRWMAVLLLVMLLMSAGSAVICTRRWFSKAGATLLEIQAQSALLSVLRHYDSDDLIRLRRTSQGEIIAISVDGMTLSTLKSEYLQLLMEDRFVSWQLRIPAAIAAGAPLFSWVPLKIPFSTELSCSWQVSVLSRTVENEYGQRHFQLILQVKGSGVSKIGFLKAQAEQETVLAEIFLQ